MKFLLSLTLFLFLSAAAVTAQTPPAARVTGTVTAVDAAAKQITVKTDKGDTVTISTTDKSFLFRLPPGETDMKKAPKIAFSDLAAGDRILASGQQPADGKTMDARTIVIMTKGDVEGIHQKETEDWQKRGTVGIVSTIDPATKSLTLKAGSKEVAVHVSDKTEFMRYALESAKLSDAKPGKFEEIKAGDEVHVLGNKDGDGASVTAEKLVSGSFKQIAATIKSVSATSGELVATDLATKKPITIHVIGDSTMKKLPADLAAMLARRYNRPAGGDAAAGGRGPGGQGGQGGMNRGGGAPGGPGGPGGGGRGGGRGGDIKTMLDNAPAVTLADLKAGDAVMITTTEGTNPGHATAIMLLAGVEPLLTASPTATRDIMSGWNLGGGGGGGEGN
jgi:hypothetical protein